jgi:uncharacterized protein (TIGR02246 family)
MRLTALLTCFAICSTAAAQTVEDQIRAEVSRYVGAINRGDPQAIAALYLNDTKTSSLGDGQIYRGWQTIAELLREVYSQAGTIEMTVDSVSVFPLGTDVALAVMRYQWLIGRASPERGTGAMTLLYTRTPRGWRVAHDHTSTLATSTPGTASVIPATDSGPSMPGCAARAGRRSPRSVRSVAGVCLARWHVGELAHDPRGMGCSSHVSAQCPIRRLVGGRGTPSP